MVTRRNLLKAAVGAVPLGCAGLPVVDERERDGLSLSLSLDIDAGIRAALDHHGTAWLSRADSVFVKVACNSPATHPSVTSPLAVASLCRALFERGAGRVLVGDQSGVMSVRLAAGEARFNSTRTVMDSNGLLAAIVASGAQPHFFDDDGFDAGYVQARMPIGADAWSQAPHIARIVTSVDHIIYLPRLAAHCLTGYTHGHKLAVGWLRDDARHAMHFDAGTLYEKYTEVNYCDQIQQRLRLVLTAVDRVLVDGGPDDGAIASAQPAIVLAGPHLANHDAVSVALLTWAQRELPRSGGRAALGFGPWAFATNAGLLASVGSATGIPWTSSAAWPSTYLPHDFAAGVWSDRALLRAYALLGGVPRRIAVAVLGGVLPKTLSDRLSALTA